MLGSLFDTFAQKESRLGFLYRRCLCILLIGLVGFIPKRPHMRRLIFHLTISTSYRLSPGFPHWDYAGPHPLQQILPLGVFLFITRAAGPT